MMMRMETRVLIPSSLAVTLGMTSPKIKKELVEDDQSDSEEPVISSSSPFPLRRPRNTRSRRNKEDDEDYEDEETEVAVTTSDEEEDEESKIKKSLPNSSTKNTKTKNSKSGFGEDLGRICIVAKHFLPRLSRFHANEGNIQLISELGEEQLPPLTPHDIRLVFGCVDRVVVEAGVRIRVCNWLRFLRTTDETNANFNANIFNVVGAFSSGQVDFTLTKDVAPGEELVASFDISSLSQLHQVKDTPLDLSSSTDKLSHDKEKSNSDKSTLDSLYQKTKHHRQEDKNLSQPRQKPTPFSISAVLGDRVGGGGGSVGLRPILRTRGRERSLLPCEVCGKQFDRPSLLKRHMRTHTGEKPHICDVCGKGFSTSSSLNTHRRIHSGEKPHQCPVCGKRFTASSNLYYHRMTHNKEKPHKCLLCGKSFPTPGDLKSHQYVHSGSWPYNCPICHRGFSKQTNLRNHLLLHSGDKPHNCHLCSKKFALACNLRAHLRTHEEEDLVSNNAIGANNKDSSSSPSLRKEETSTTTSSTTAGGFVPMLHHHHPLTFSSAYSGHSLVLPHAVPPAPSSNPFLEQLFQWNYRFAKETAGSLNMMQQKLLESQMLAAHLMIGSGPSASSTTTQDHHIHRNLMPLVPFSVSDLIRASGGGGSVGSGGLRLPLSLTHPLDPQLPIFPSDLNKFMQQ